jgi:hypothetical protein
VSRPSISFAEPVISLIHNELAITIVEIDDLYPSLPLSDDEVRVYRRMVLQECREDIPEGQADNLVRIGRLLVDGPRKEATARHSGVLRTLVSDGLSEEPGLLRSLTQIEEDLARTRNDHGSWKWVMNALYLCMVAMLVGVIHQAIRDELLLIQSDRFQRRG